MLVLRKLTLSIECVVSINEITPQSVRKLNNLNSGGEGVENGYDEEGIERQQRLLHAILNNKDVLHKVIKRQIAQYLDEPSGDLRNALGVEEDELEVAIGPAIDTL